MSRNTICKEHPTFNCLRIVLFDLVKKVMEAGSGQQRKGSARPIGVTVEQIADDCRLLVCSQEESPGTHVSIRKIAPQFEISKSSVHRILKKT